MLKCNLAVLLAERNLKITKVSSDTGISRTTLTSLANNYSQGIQFETLNALCSYLRISPADFFCYVPFEVDVKAQFEETDKVSITLIFTNSQGKSLDSINFVVNAVFAEYTVDNVPATKRHCKGKFTIMIESPDDFEQAIDLYKYSKNLPLIFVKEIEERICTAIAGLYFKNENDICDLDFDVVYNNAFS